MLRFLPFLMLAADAGGGAGAGADPKPADPKPAEPVVTPKTDTPDPAAQELAELRKWRAEREAADKAKAEEEAKKRGEWETLHKTEKERADKAEAELGTYREQEKARVKALKAENEEALKALPADIQALAPEGATPDQLQAWIKRASKAVPDTRPAGTVNGGKPPPKVVLTEAEKAEAKRRGLTEEQWATILVQSGRKKVTEAK